ncbi:hypothetical protein AB4Y90_15110 [Chryseobacterium sp. 2TAF14]|uniref:hypothetical protein n=1 Tax=Chryseobacterium sp. 2TAF14 TaxID=3233007 RepID=UPI003F90B8EB
MTTNTRIELIDLSDKSSELIQKVNVHETSSTITTINSEFHKDYLIRTSPELQELLNAINERLRKLQIIHYSYFEDLNEQIISGNISFLPFEKNYEFFFNTNNFTKSISINTPFFYKEIINNEFQTFILTTATIFENIVRLTEILTKKVVIYKTNAKLLSIPLGTYVDFLKSLLRLDYRSATPFVNCFNNHDDFLNTYLETVNLLRNSFIHGYKSQLELNPVSRRYMILKFGEGLTISMPQAEVKLFTADLVERLIAFVKDLLDVLISEVDSSSSLPF